MDGLLFITEDIDGDQWIALVRAKSRRALSKAVKDANWRQNTGCGVDCTGRVFMGWATLLRAYRIENNGWVGVVAYGNARDV